LRLQYLFSLGYFQWDRSTDSSQPNRQRGYSPRIHAPKSSSSSFLLRANHIPGAKRVPIPDTSVRSAKTCVSHFEDDRRRVARIIAFIQERRRNVSTEKAHRVLPSVFFLCRV